MQPVTTGEFAGLMAALGPFAAGRRVAVAVSGGGDSMALALLAAGWGEALCLIVDHGLRAESAEEAVLTASRLGGLGIAHRVLRVEGLLPGAGVAARARDARYGVMRAAMLDAGLTDLLLAHHRADQAESVLMRRAAFRGPAGLAGMAVLSETPAIRLLRPLLAVPPGRLRATLRAAGLAWVEDPSNADTRSTRVRTRLSLNDSAGDGAEIAGLAEAARQAGLARAAEGAAVAAELASCCSFWPEGFVVIDAKTLSEAGLASLIRMVTGAAYPPRGRGLRRLARDLRPATMAGARLLPAGKMGPGFLLVREARGVAAMTPAVADMVWDGRFLLAPGYVPPACAVVVPGGEARHRHLPAAVRAALPRLLVAGEEVAAPFWFVPANMAAPAPFMPSFW
jgi:tRNA(Ile)-lysidine synthase